MYFCYPKQLNQTIARIIAMLACRQLFPLTARQLSHVLHVIADDKHQRRLANSGCIRPGSTVELINLDTNQRGWLQLVKPGQASYADSRISVLSPLGSALLGATVETDIQLTLLCHCLRFRVLTVLNTKHNTIRSL